MPLGRIDVRGAARSARRQLLSAGIFIHTQVPSRARTKPNLWRPSINYNILGTVIHTPGLLNFVLIRVSLFLSQQFFPSAEY